MKNDVKKLCLFTYNSKDDDLKLLSVNLSKIWQKNPQNNAILPNQLILNCSGELKKVLKSTLGLEKRQDLPFMLQWPELYEKHIVVRENANNSVKGFQLQDISIFKIEIES